MDRELVNSHVRNPKAVKVCELMQDNQEFVVSNPYLMPEGICAHAWADIRSQVLAIATGGSFKFLKDENSAIAACTDLFRPVVFRIERLSDASDRVETGS